MPIRTAHQPDINLSKHLKQKNCPVKDRYTRLCDKWWVANRQYVPEDLLYKDVRPTYRNSTQGRVNATVERSSSDADSTEHKDADSAVELATTAIAPVMQQPQRAATVAAKEKQKIYIKEGRELDNILEQDRLKKMAADSSDESDRSVNAEPMAKRRRHAIKI
jgi:hypothetical protein